MPIGLTNLFGSLFGGPASLTPVNTTALIPAQSTGGDITQAFGPSGQYRADEIIADIYNGPWRGPLDLDNYGCESPAMRLEYRRSFLKEPIVKAAVTGKTAAIASLDLAVLPASKSKLDAAISEGVKFFLDKSEHGAHGLLRNILIPAFVDGWSLCETVLRTVDYGKWKGLDGLHHCRQVDTAFCRLQLDQFRNVTGVVNLRAGIQIYPPRKTLLFTYNGLHNSPFGNSDLRACFRSVGLIEDAYRAWFVAIMRYGTPYIVGKYSQAQNKEVMKQAIAELYAGGYMVTDNESAVEVLSLASGSNFQAFEAKIKMLREEVLFAVRNTPSPFAEGRGSKEGHHDTAVAKVSSDSQEYLLAKDAALCINRQLIPVLVEENWGRMVDRPTVVIAGTNWAETKAQLEVGALLLEKYKLPLSKGQCYEVGQFSPPDGDEDIINPPADAQSGVGGLPGMGGGNPVAGAIGGKPGTMPTEPVEAKQPSMPQTFAAATSDEAKRCVDRILANSKRLAA